MSGEDASRFRKRAIHCRELAANTFSDLDRQTLRQMGNELDEEADRLDAEEVATPKIIIEPKSET